MRPPADRDVSAMVKPVPPTTAMSRVSIDSMTASGGGRSRSRVQEVVDLAGVALHLDDGTGAVVAHGSGQAECRRARVDERPESHALDDAAHADTQPAPAGHGKA